MGRAPTWEKGRRGRRGDRVERGEGMGTEVGRSGRGGEVRGCRDRCEMGQSHGRGGKRSQANGGGAVRNSPQFGKAQGRDLLSIGLGHP